MDNQEEEEFTDYQLPENKEEAKINVNEYADFNWDFLSHKHHTKVETAKVEEPKIEKVEEMIVEEPIRIEKPKEVPKETPKEAKKKVSKAVIQLE